MSATMRLDPMTPAPPTAGPVRQALDIAAARTHSSGPVICLIVPASSREEFRPIRQSRFARMRKRLRRGLNRLLWMLGRTPDFHYSSYEDRRDTNRGDMAIRRASVELLQAAFGGGASVIDVGWHEVPALDAGWFAAHIDLLVIGGGGYYFLDAAGRIAPRVARDMALLRGLRCPIVTLSPGVNQLLGLGAVPGAVDPATAALLGELLGLLRLSSARDLQSRDLLDRIAPGRSVALPDPALFLAAQPPSQPLPPRPPGTLAIGLNIAFHGSTQSTRLAARVRLFAAAARALMRRHRCGFVYFVHYESERAIPPLLRAAGLPVTVADLPAEQMLPHYAALDVHVCQMLHSSILAANAGVPTVTLGYDVKNRAFFEMMHQARWCLDEDTTSAAQLCATIEAALANRAALARGIAGRKAALRQDMDRYLEAMVALLPPPSR